MRKKLKPLKAKPIKTKWKFQLRENDTKGFQCTATYPTSFGDKKYESDWLRTEAAALDEIRYFVRHRTFSNIKPGERHD